MFKARMERNLMNRSLYPVVLIALTLVAGAADAASYFARTGLAGTNWNAANMWSNTSCAAGGPVAGPPTAADDVIICNGKTVTVNIAGAVAGSVTIEGGGNNTSLTMGGVGTTLTVTNAGGRSGNVVINAPSAGVTKQISVGARSLNVTGSVTIGSATAGASNNNIAQLAITTGTATIGSLNVAGGTVNSIARATVTTGTLNINGSASIATGTLGRGLMTLTGGTINVNGDLAVSAAASTNTSGDATVEVTNAAGLLNVTGNATVTGGGAADRDALLRVTVASNVNRGIAIGGNLNINATVATSSSVTLGTDSRMTVAGNVNNGDTLTDGAGRFTMSMPGTTLTTRNNAIAATTSVTTGTLDARNMVVDSGSLGLSRLLLSSTGTINVDGNLTVTTSASTGNAGDATAEVTAAGGLLNVTGNATVTGGAATDRDAVLRVTVGSNAGRGITIGGNLDVNATVAGSSAVTLAGGTAPNTAKMTVGGAVTNNDTISISTGELTVTGGYTQVNRPFTVQTTLTTGTFTVGGVLTNNATETITISTTGIVNANGGFTNSGTFTNSAAGQLFLRGAANTIDGTFNDGTGTVTMNGSVAQALSGTALFPPTTAADGFFNFTVNNAAGVTLGSNVVARNIITFTSGEVTTGANVLIAERTCATSVSRTSGHVIGNFQKNIPAGASSCTYELGSAGAYTPVALAFATAGAGRLIGRVTTPDHPNIGTSGLDASKSVNRWWTLTTTGVSGTAIPSTGTYGAIFTFLNPSGFDGGANPLNFEVERRTGASWFTTTTGTRTATTTQATGITALGDFALAEKTVVITPPDSFNAVEVGAAINGRLFTKLRGTGFTLDIVAILGGVLYNTFNEAVTVDLVTGGSGGLNCGGGALTVIGGPTDVTLVNGRVTTPAFNLATAYPDVRVRVRYPVGGPYTVTTCSSDNFSIRPPTFTVTSTDATNTATSGTPAIKTGANFNLTAAGGAGYTGTPTNNTTGNVTGTPTAGTIGGTFNAAVGGTASGNFFYSEVGHIGLSINAVSDTSFSSVDSAGGDCTNDFSNALVGGRYGCWIGSTAVTQSTGVSGFGRFIPDNFNVTYNVPAIAPACTGFSYVGQTFNYTTVPVMTITARNGTNNGLTNATTVNYAGSYAKFTNAQLALAPYDTKDGRYLRFDALGGGSTPDLDRSGLPDPVTSDPVISAFTAGVGTFTFSGGSGFGFARTTPSAPFDADIAVRLNVIDTDNVTFAGNPASFGTASAGSGILFSDGVAATTTDKQVRYGRLSIGGASGSQVLPLRLPVQAQYWTGTAFATNTLDSCTTLAANNVGLGNYSGSLNAGETTPSIVNSPLQAGRSAIRLSAPGSANPGSVDVALNLGAGAAADACAGFAPAATAGNKTHLRGAWCNPPGTYTKDPSAKARFGVTRGADQSIYRREQ